MSKRKTSLPPQAPLKAPKTRPSKSASLEDAVTSLVKKKFGCHVITCQKQKLNDDLVYLQVIISRKAALSLDDMATVVDQLNSEYNVSSGPKPKSWTKPQIVAVGTNDLAPKLTPAMKRRLEQKALKDAEAEGLLDDDDEPGVKAIERAPKTISKTVKGDGVGVSTAADTVPMSRPSSPGTMEML